LNEQEQPKARSFGSISNPCGVHMV